ncbi:uncharacterized protein LOC123309981 [Coccinella septempunctata]|uniref:uncharacterized protein LOC123309981 n=1 Tax=Coccinella septempunctata TaxID=41139 RepID=UPI001D092A55|nr:uncharacterized protein LOC123309981 [Coccinella septempunctata]
MPKKYPWPTAGLQKYSERLKTFIHERCTCYPNLDDDMFEVPEFLVIDPIKRRPSKFKLSFADDFPYTRFKDNEFNNETCACNLCSVCECNMNLKPFPHYVLYREQLPPWTRRAEVRFRKPVPEKRFSSVSQKGWKPEPMKQKMETDEARVKKSEKKEEPPVQVRRKISAFSFDDDPSKFPYL